MSSTALEMDPTTSNQLDIHSIMKTVHEKFSLILKRKHYLQYSKASKNTETELYIYKLTIQEY